MELLLATLVVLTLAGVALLFNNDPEDALIRAARTALQTSLGLVLAAGVGPLTMSAALNILTPGLIAGATVIHASLQPAVRE